VHHADTVGDRQRLFLIVGDPDRRDARLVDDPADLLAHGDAKAHVEVRKRFVQQENVGLRCQRARERDALFLSARELARAIVAVVRQVDEVEQLLDAGLTLALATL